APSRIARIIGFLIARFRWMFSISTVASSTRMPTASASPPSVMMLTVWPSAPSTMIEHKIDNGIEVATTSVERQFPRKRRIISAVHLLDRQIVQHLQDLRTGIEPHIVFTVADFLRAGRQNDVLHIDRVANVGG